MSGGGDSSGGVGDGGDDGSNGINHGNSGSVCLGAEGRIEMVTGAGSREECQDEML